MSEISPELRDRAATSIFEAGLLKFGEFTLKSGIKSPFYMDFRAAQSHPETFHLITDVYASMVDDTDPSVFLAGVPEAGTPLAAAVGYKLERPLLQPRKVVKDHGTKSSVEGDFNHGDRVILIDDLITKGDSKLEAIEQVTQAGLEIEKFIVLVDREQGGLETVRNAGYNIEAAFGITALVEALLKQGKITQEQYSTVVDFVKNN